MTDSNPSFPSSAELVAELRELDEELRHLPFSPYGSVLHVKLLGAAAAIERLSAELTKLRRDYAAIDAGLQSGFDELRAERDRYKAALARIANRICSCRAHDLAREALAGAEDDHERR